MTDLLEQHRTQLSELCRLYRVKTLEIFGSAASDGWDTERSDLDFLVQFEPLGPGRYFDAYFDLKDALKSLFGREVDLVSPRAIRNPYFLASVNRSRRVLYAA